MTDTATDTRIPAYDPLLDYIVQAARPWNLGGYGTDQSAKSLIEAARCQQRRDRDVRIFTDVQNQLHGTGDFEVVVEPHGESPGGPPFLYIDLQDATPDGKAARVDAGYDWFTREGDMAYFQGFVQWSRLDPGPDGSYDEDMIELPFADAAAFVKAIEHLIHKHLPEPMNADEAHADMVRKMQALGAALNG